MAIIFFDAYLKYDRKHGTHDIQDENPYSLSCIGKSDPEHKHNKCAV
jgi:hypothetical protein